LYDSQNNFIGEAGSVWLELKNIKKMYERAISGPQPPIPSTYTTASPPAPNITYSVDTAGGTLAFEPGWDQTDDYVVFTHGFNQDYDHSTNYAETMSKRLWWHGYRGRFASFRWQTYGNGGLGGAVGTYNDSEYVAWNSGTAFKQFVESLPASRRIALAHSMGNMVVGSALQAGLALDGYGLLHSATSASCYNNNLSTYPQTQTNAVASSEQDAGTFTKTLLYTRYLANIGGDPVNFYDEQDSTLTYWWTVNNHSFKPQLSNGMSSGSGYNYSASAPDGQRLYLRFLSLTGFSYRFLTDPSEAKAYVDFSLTDPVGRTATARGSIGSAVPVNFLGTDHGAEWSLSIQHSAQFYDLLVQELGL
jgi:Alpha/beta hydrolase of unknown function (DUF900)